MLKPLTNNRSLLSALHKGYLDEIGRDLNLYQTIQKDDEWECVDGTPCRQKEFHVKHSKGIARWQVEWRKGFVVRVEVTHQI